MTINEYWLCCGCSILLDESLAHRQRLCFVYPTARVELIEDYRSLSCGYLETLVEQRGHHRSLYFGYRVLAQETLSELQSCILAQEIVTLQTMDEPSAIARAQQHGFTHRRYGSDLAFWIPQQLELKELLERFEGLPVDAISRSPVKLEHIYLEVTQQMA